MAETLITGTTVITMDPQRRVLENAAIAVVDGRIAAVGPSDAIAAQYPAARRIDGRRKLVMPGLIDGHAHAGHALVKTVGSGQTDAWFKAVQKIYSVGSDEEFWRAEAMLAAVERLKCGTTTGISLMGGGHDVHRTDDPIFGDLHCQATEKVGIRTFLAVGPNRGPFPLKYTRWTDGAARPTPVSFEQQMTTCETLIGRWHGKADGRVNICIVAPVFHPEDEQKDGWLEADAKVQLRAARALGRKHKLIFTQDGHRSGSLKWCHENADLLGPDAMMSHSVDLLAEEIPLSAATGTTIVHNPSAIMSIRGRCPVPELLDAGARVVLGSDGVAPDRSYDMFRHGWQAMHYHRRHFRDANILPPGKTLEMMTIDAAHALGLGGEIGSVEVGKRADLIVIDMFKPHLYPPNMPVYRIAYFASGADVDTVMVNGTVVMEGRKVLTVDEGRVLEDAARAAETMIARNDLGKLIETPAAIWGRSRLQ